MTHTIEKQQNSHQTPKARKGKFTPKALLLVIALLALFGMFGLALNTRSASAAGCAKPASGTPTSLVPFNVPAKGTYVMWIRMKIPNSTSDSLLAQVGATYCFTVGGKSVPPNTWTWVNYQNNVTNVPDKVNFTLTGKHTVYLIGNKPGVSVDRVMFTSDTSCKPTGTTGSNCQSSSDTTPPTVSLTAPAAGSTVSGNVALSATASDTSGVTSVAFLVDGKSVNTDTASPYSFSWNSTTIANGTHTIVAQATDKAGNTATSKSVSVTVKNSTTSNPTPPPTTSGWPNASNTGVPAGTSLTASGSLTVTQANTVINGKNITGTVEIKANNVTIQNSKINAGSNYWGVSVTSGSVTIKNSEIIGSDAAAVTGDNYTLNAVYIHDFHGDGMKLGNNSTIENSYIYNAVPQNGQHADGMQLQGGASNVLIKHNRIDVGSGKVNGSDSAVFIKNDLGPNNTVGPVTIDNNLLGGGGYSLYVYKGGSGLAQGGVSVTNNHFLRDYEYGPVAVNIPVVKWSGNVYDDTGAVINP